MTDRDAIVTRSGTVLGDALADLCVMDPYMTKNEAMIFVRTMSEQLRSRVPAGQSKEADSYVEHLATMLRRAWGGSIRISEIEERAMEAEREHARDLLDAVHAPADPAPPATELANNFLNGLSLENRRAFLSAIHFCQRCGANTKWAPCGCSGTPP